MISTGIVRKVDELGRLVIPKEMRKILEINEGTEVEMERNGDVIIVKKYLTSVCPKCNTKIHTNDNYCKTCGFKLNNKEEETRD